MDRLISVDRNGLRNEMRLGVNMDGDKVSVSLTLSRSELDSVFKCEFAGAENAHEIIMFRSAMEYLHMCCQTDREIEFKSDSPWFVEQFQIAFSNSLSDDIDLYFEKQSDDDVLITVYESVETGVDIKREYLFYFECLSLTSYLDAFATEWEILEVNEEPK
jgi:hypothetical protein